MSPLFKISKGNDSNNKRQKFINPGMSNIPDSNPNVISPGNNNQNNNTFVYGSIPNQNINNQSMMNNNQVGNINMNNNVQPDMQKKFTSDELMMPKSVQPPKHKEEKIESVVEELDLPEVKLESLDEVESLDEKF